MACLSLGKRKRNDLLAAIILSGNVSPVHLCQRPSIKVAEAFIAPLYDGPASGYGLADRREPQRKALAPLMRMPPSSIAARRSMEDTRRLSEDLQGDRSRNCRARVSGLGRSRLCQAFRFFAAQGRSRGDRQPLAVEAGQAFHPD
jgi:hypothetical protein